MLHQIGAYVYPKKLETIKEDTTIFNADSLPIKMKYAQYFIDLQLLHGDL